MALIKEKGKVQLKNTEQPACERPNQVLIRVRMTGICRTDLAVMRATLPAPDPLIVGHEFAGEIVALGSDCPGLEVGMRVTAMPLLACGQCLACRANRSENCFQGKMLGLHVAGAFAEYLVLPAKQVYPVPEGIDWQTAAFSEPVAAAAAVLQGGIAPEQIGAIVGQGRIAELSLRLLRSQGFERVCIMPQLSELGENAFDWLIETGLSAPDLNPLLRALRPQGRLLLKSRHLPTLQFDPQWLIRKELHVQGVYYGPFDWVMTWLDSHQGAIRDLLGQVYPLQAWEAAIAAAEAGESQKIFIAWP